MSDENEDLMSSFLPSNPADKKKIRQSLEAITAQMQMIADRREVVKELYAALHSDYKIPKKVLRKLAKTMYDANFNEVTTEHTQFELIYESIVDTNVSTDDTTELSDAEDSE